ncbi:TPA: restriction endonuclease subunit S [Vibrio parahaemolyticus]|nr:restriction endonuclease subunit S [Vibrio parahaemolyticus]HBC3931281.1 restriction endonuclease subunit S [Vibrio parahaemolyticus]HBC3964727.1 restriction endonuclease subunit S [Vibrio parahaemolyticus]
MVPNGWEKSPVGKLCKSIVPGRNKPKVFDGDIPWVTTPEISGKYIPSAKQKNYISQSVAKECGAKIVPKGAVIIAAVGELGLTAIAKEEIILNQQLHAFVCPPNVNNEYLAYFLSAQKPYMDTVASKTTIPYMNKSNCESIPVLLPPLPEQRKIAQILSTWDKAIATTEKLIDTSKQQKKALMQQLLTGKKRLVDSETGKAFEGDWENVSLKKLISEVKKTKEIEPNIIELLTVKLHHKGVKASGKYPNATKGGRPYYKRYTGELIIGRQNLHNGGIAIVTEECDGLIASNAISSFEVTSIADVQFILNKMSTAHFIYTIDNLTGGTGQKEISVKELLKIKISTPSITEQQKIASVLTAADKDIELLEAKLAHLKQEKKALMQQLLTGKRRVKVTETEAA